MRLRKSASEPLSKIKEVHWAGEWVVTFLICFYSTTTMVLCFEKIIVVRD